MLSWEKIIFLACFYRWRKSACRYLWWVQVQKFKFWFAFNKERLKQRLRGMQQTTNELSEKIKYFDTTMYKEASFLDEHGLQMLSSSYISSIWLTELLKLLQTAEPPAVRSWFLYPVSFLMLCAVSLLDT